MKVTKFPNFRQMSVFSLCFFFLVTFLLSLNFQVLYLFFVNFLVSNDFFDIALVIISFTDFCHQQKFISIYFQKFSQFFAIYFCLFTDFLVNFVFQLANRVVY